jgi:hypothetical protein
VGPHGDPSGLVDEGDRLANGGGAARDERRRALDQIVSANT